MRYISPRLKAYSIFIVDPIEFTVPPSKLSAQGRAEVARYFRSKLIEVIKARGHSIATDVGVGVARIQIAMTGIAESTWWKKLHPGMRVTGAGTGGASCEAEIVDSVTGEQLAAWIATASGSQFDFTAFSTVADIKSVIDRWADSVVVQLDELRSSYR